MDIYEALYTTRTMRRLRPDRIPLDTQAPFWMRPFVPPMGATPSAGTSWPSTIRN